MLFFFFFSKEKWLFRGNLEKCESNFISSRENMCFSRERKCYALSLTTALNMICGLTKGVQMKEMEKYRIVTFKEKQKLSGFRLITMNLLRMDPLEICT